MKILFLDDDLNRHAGFDEAFRGDGGVDNEIHFVETAKEAIELLKENVYDTVCLDHDLGGLYFVDSGDDTGYEVAEWIGENLTYTPIIIIHSMNPIGGVKMHKSLESNGFRSILYPYSVLVGM